MSLAMRFLSLAVVMMFLSLLVEIAGPQRFNWIAADVVGLLMLGGWMVFMRTLGFR